MAPVVAAAMVIALAALVTVMPVPAVMVAGRTLLSRVLDAVPLAARTVVVAPDPVSAAAGDAAGQVHWTLENPPLGGPAAGVAAGLAELRNLPGEPAEWVMLLACDLPWAAAAARLLLDELARSAGPPSLPDGFHLVDNDGHAQWLAGVYRADALRAGVARLGSDLRGASIRSVLAGLALRGIPDRTGSGQDVDTWQDVHASTLRLHTEESTPMSDSVPLPPEALDEWLLALTAKLGLDADAVPVGLLLDVARDVAHNVARPAAPLSTFLVGLAAARAGGTEADVRAACAAASELALSWPGEGH